MRPAAAGVRSVVASVEEVGAFGLRLRAEPSRLGLVDAARESILGDGAEWIWNLAATQFVGAGQVVDVYPAVEKLAEAGRSRWLRR